MTVTQSYNIVQKLNSNNTNMNLASSFLFRFTSKPRRRFHHVECKYKHRKCHWKHRNRKRWNKNRFV